MMNIYKLLLWGALLSFFGCTSGKQENDVNTLNVGDSITTIDGVAYYWQQFAEDSARISAIENGGIVEQCLVTGPVFGAIAADDDRFLLIDCGEGQYHPFDTKLIPKELNLMTEEDVESYNIEDEDADYIIDIE